MGKIKRERQKFHITAAESKAITTIEQKEKIKYKPIKAQLDAVENIFSGINIQLDSINKFEEVASAPSKDEIKLKEETKLVEPDAVDAVIKSLDNKASSTGAPEKHLTKKEKMALKHQKLMEKLDVTHKARLQLKKKKPKSKQSEHLSDQTLAVSKSEFSSLLTPAAVKPSTEAPKNNNAAPRNVFSIPLLKDDLPPLNSIFGQKLNKTTQKSKNIGKSKNSKKNFVANYNFLKNAMAKKKK